MRNGTFLQASRVSSGNSSSKGMILPRPVLASNLSMSQTSEEENTEAFFVSALWSAAAVSQGMTEKDDLDFREVTVSLSRCGNADETFLNAPVSVI